MISMTKSFFWVSAVVLSLMLCTSGALAGNSTVPTDFATIQAAIDDAGTMDGDTITVLGTHLESGIHVTKAVTIKGQGINITSIQTDGAVGTGIGFYLDVNDISFEDMTIEKFSQGVRFEDAGNTIRRTKLRRVRFRDNSSRGIEVHNDTTVKNLLVKQCKFENTNIGLRVSSSGHLNDARFDSSEFTNNDIGIYEANDGGTSTMKDLEVKGCTFTGHTSYAIFLEEIQNALIENNEFVDNYRDIQIFKWYQASVPVSNVVIRNNTMKGTTNAVFAIFNAKHSSGQTIFDGVYFEGNTAETAGDGTSNKPGGFVYAGAYSSSPSDGSAGLGWDTVHITCNNFTGTVTPARGVRFYDPDAVDDNTLGGASIDVQNNWWGTAVAADVMALMHHPPITNYTPFLSSEAQDGACLCNDYLNLLGFPTTYDPGDPRAPAGVFTINSTFENADGAILKDIHFKTVELSSNTGGNQVLNADGGPGGVGSIVTVPSTALGPDGVLSPDESFDQAFEIGLEVREPFTFFVDAYCTPLIDGVEDIP